MTKVDYEIVGEEEVRTLPIIEPVNYTMNVEVKKTKTKTKKPVELVIVEENDYMNELMECVKCNRNDIPRHLLHWNANGSYTDTCQECFEAKELDTLFAKELEVFLRKQHEGYRVRLNNEEKYWKSRCKIITTAEFNCNVYDRKCGWTECRKCHIKYGCNMSREFKNFIETRGYKCEFLDCCRTGLFRCN